jgi:large subunit ribosomal protein L31
MQVVDGQQLVRACLRSAPDRTALVISSIWRYKVLFAAKSYPRQHDFDRTTAMKDKIHPQYMNTEVSCSCGNKFTTRSTKKELKVDICANCHPFYTGTMKYIDTAGRIEKFQSKFAAGTYNSVQKPASKTKKKVVIAQPEV